MLPGVKDIHIYQGDTFIMTVRLKLSAARNVTDYVDLTGATATAQIRSTEVNPTILATMTCEVLDQTTNMGEITITMSTSQTASLTADGVWDLQVTFPNGHVRTYLKGAALVGLQVTR